MASTLGLAQMLSLLKLGSSLGTDFGMLGPDLGTLETDLFGPYRACTAFLSSPLTNERGVLWVLTNERRALPELEVGVPAPVEGGHHCLPLVWVGQAEAVAQLVHYGLLQVGALREKWRYKHYTTQLAYRTNRGKIKIQSFISERENFVLVLLILTRKTYFAPNNVNMYIFVMICRI